MSDQTPRSAESDLGLHCLLMSLLWDTRLKWVKRNNERTEDKEVTITEYSLLMTPRGKVNNHIQSESTTLFDWPSIWVEFKAAVAYAKYIDSSC